ncbi:hypothetical protein FACS1894166_10460 [Bacilli bacterium]|nr:hypothetical protein FACS1894166_10460 [Bacilli bacterium]
MQKRKIKESTLIISNHKKVMDGVFMTLVFIHNHIRTVAAEFLYDNYKSLRVLLNTLDGIKVNRFSPDIEFINKCVSILSKPKRTIMMFPEGRLPIPGETRILPFKYSYLLIALQAKCKIMVVYHDGNYGMFKRTHIAISKPIDIAQYCHKTNPSVAELTKLSRIFEDKMREMKLLVVNRGHAVNNKR